MPKSHMEYSFQMSPIGLIQNWNTVKLKNERCGKIGFEVLIGVWIQIR